MSQHNIVCSNKVEELKEKYLSQQRETMPRHKMKGREQKTVAAQYEQKSVLCYDISKFFRDIKQS